jgi:hypothetical protein
VTEVTNDYFNLLGLVIFRCIAAAYHTGDMQCVDNAYSTALANLGSHQAGTFIGRMIALVHALRAERKSMLHFLPAPCCKATADERVLLAFLAASRQNENDADCALLRALVGRDDAPATRETMSLIAESLDEAARRSEPAGSPGASAQFH